MSQGTRCDDHRAAHPNMRAYLSSAVLVDGHRREAALAARPWLKMDRNRPSPTVATVPTETRVRQGGEQGPPLAACYPGLRRSAQDQRIGCDRSDGEN